jgi:enoyl-CoA hydratase/carnithine racemase
MPSSKASKSETPKSVTKTVGRLYFLDLSAGRVLTSNPDGTDLKTIVNEGRKLPDGIVVDVAAGHIYWTNMGNPKANDGTIDRADLDGKNVTNIVPSGATWTPKQLQLDAKNRKLYWSDREGMRVMRSNLDGSNVETLVETGHGDADRLDARNWCVGIAVDVNGGKLYWTQKGNDNAGQGRIFRSGLEIPKGQTPGNRKDIEILYDNLPEPIDLDLDLGNRLFYWTDRGDPPRGNTVNRAPMDAAAGKRKEPEIIFNHLMEGIGLSLDLANGRFTARISTDRIRKISSSPKEIYPESHTRRFLRVPSLAPISLINYEERIMSSPASALKLENVLYEKKGPIAHVTINRPKVLNALNAKTISELRSAFEDARDDSEVRGVVFTGAGDKAFAAGADIGEMANDTPLTAEQKTRAGQALTDLIENLGKPVIAAVNGFALGGGCELSMASTIRIAAETARFGQPEVKIGVMPGYGGTQRLPRLIGKGRALQLILSGEIIDAQEAYRIGLVNEVVPAANLIARVEALLNQIISNAPVGVKYSIEAVNKGLDTSLSEGFLLEASLFAICAGTEDKKEGTSAFLAKRAPKFQGR